MNFNLDDLRTIKKNSNHKMMKTLYNFINETPKDEEHNNNSKIKNKCIYSENNRIYFRSYVTGESVETLIQEINKKNDNYEKLLKNFNLKNAVPEPIYLHISSYGGSLLACMRAVDIIKRSTIPIYTVVDGYAASAATLMSVVGRKRLMTPSSYMLIHQLSNRHTGKFNELKDDFENSEMLMEDIYNIFIENTNMKREELVEFLKHDLWWKSDRCLETGLVDEFLN